MTDEQRNLLRELLYAAQPEFGKRFTALLANYVNGCETETERHLLENVVRNKVDRESKMIFFRILRRLLEKLIN
ncbi:MAG: hypothetical protein K8S87_01680 [Planctomycetes bacterium]|nr:hypothetical protein [Planctomycetota bacterium]